MFRIAKFKCCFLKCCLIAACDFDAVEEHKLLKRLVVQIVPHLNVNLSKKA